MESRQHRPTAVTVVAIILSLAAAIAFITGFTLLVPDTLLSRIWALNPRAYAAFARGGRASGMLLLVVGLAAAATARGWLRGRRWAWLLSFVILGMNGLGDVIDGLVTGDWLRAGPGVLVAALLVAVLLRSEVRIFFANRS